MSIDCDLETGGDGQASLDVVKFPWVISNLVANAMRVTPSGESVKLVYRETDSNLKIDIIDRGPGIPEGFEEKIFQPYYQIKDEKKSSKVGILGLGLTIAREVVRAHGGEISVLSRCPGGSTFTVNLPKADVEV